MLTSRKACARFGFPTRPERSFCACLLTSTGRWRITEELQNTILAMQINQYWLDLASPGPNPFGEKFKQFAIRESDKFGHPMEHLVSPTGQPRDRLGIKLHWPTRNTISDLAFGTTADPGSTLTRLLMEKGAPIEGVIWLGCIRATRGQPWREA